jgi:hypothetical protein
MSAAAASRIRFTIFEAPYRLSKRYWLATDGSVGTESTTKLWQGNYRVVDFDAGDPARALAEIGRTFDGLSFNQMIGLGVPRDGTIEGRITTKDRHVKGDTDVIPRSLDYFGWPDGPGLLLLDGDGIDGLQAKLCEVYPAFERVAFLCRPSASASVKDPGTGKALKTAEHGYVVIDDPSKSKACLDALLQLSWCLGSGKAAGWLKLSKSGAELVRGPVDASVGSPERPSYEGTVVIGQGLERLPRTAQVIGGTGMLCANDLLDFAERHAPAGLYAERVNAARNDPEFCARRAEVQAAYREAHIHNAGARGIPREKAAKAYDEARAAGTIKSGNWTFVPLTPEHVLYRPDGEPFTIADIQKDRLAFHRKECCDPVEGTSYQSRNCAIIYTNGPRIEIYSRAHGDAFAYVAPLDDITLSVGELLAQILAEHATSPVVEIEDEDEEEAENTGEGSSTTKADAAPNQPLTSMIGITIYDFCAYMPKHLYIFKPTGEMWPASSVNARLPRIPLKKKNGAPVRDGDGKPKYTTPSRWLDKHQAVEQMTWAPGEPQRIVGRLVSDGGWIERDGVTTFNLYRPPAPHGASNAANAGRWVELVRRIYPDNADHIIAFCAHRIQRPAEKINHGLVLTGPPGIGKDTILEPIKLGVGPWNFREVSPTDITSTFNDFMRSVVLRISEARDLGDVNRYAFYESTKTIMAAPPDVTRVNGKYIPQHYVVNVTGVILTTNYPRDGLYLPPDDRRHYVAGTEVTKDDFEEGYWAEHWAWYRAGGLADVVAYLREIDLSNFDPKKPPEKTEAFWRMVDGGMAPEVPELRDVLDRLGEVDATGKQQPPVVVTLTRVKEALPAGGDLYKWLSDPKNARTIPHRFESCGYVPVRNSSAESGLWVIAGRRQVVYGRMDVVPDERLKAVGKFKEAEDLKAAELKKKFEAGIASHKNDRVRQL